MKKGIIWTVLMLVTTLMSPQALARCNVGNAVAKIVILDMERSGDVRIKRKDSNKAIDALLYHYLCEGDRLVRTNAAKVSLQWDGSAIKKPMTQSSITINRPEGWSLVNWVEERFTRLFGETGDRAPPRATLASSRGGGQNNAGYQDGSDTPVNKTVLPFAHGYGDAQLISETREVLSIHWQGSPLWLRLTGSDGRELASPSPYGQAWTTITLPAEVTMATLTFVEPNGTTHSVKLRRAELDVKTNSLEWAAETAFTKITEWKLEAENQLQSRADESLIAADLWNRIGAVGPTER